MDTNITKARKILNKVPYLVIATSDKRNKVNNSPVFSVFDKNFNFYWNSPIDTKHSKNIRVNPNVFCVVFDSTPIDKNWYGIYMEGKAYELNKIDDVKIALAVFSKKSNITLEEDNYLNKSKHRFYKFVPKKFYINIYEKVNGVHVDGKVEVKLK